MFASGKTAAVASAANYIEDVFSTYLYTGNGSTQTITNNIDLSTKGGLVWIKRRNAVSNNRIYDTARGMVTGVGGSPYLYTNTDNGNLGTGFDASVTSSTTGFNIAQGGIGDISDSGGTYTSWTLAKAPKFFDVVTFSTTTSSTVPITVNHNLGSVPGCIILKQTNGTSDWVVYHRSRGSTKYLNLNNTDAEQTGGTSKWYATPTSTAFTLGGDFVQNATYVAYLFAHDAGGFGLTGSDNVISCGSFTTDSGGNATVSLGYEPAWVMFKCSSNAGQNWEMIDTMRGWSMSTDVSLQANSAAAEAAGGFGNPTATGFVMGGQGNTQTYIYIAIRRGPMKVPTSGTSVFSPIASSASTGTIQTTNFPVDMQISAYRPGDSENSTVNDRLRGVSSTAVDKIVTLKTSATTAESTINGIQSYNWGNTGFGIPTYLGGVSGIYWNFRRAPSFFDEVCYTGTGSATTVTHNLGVAPEFMMVKERNGANSWWGYAASEGATKGRGWNSSNAFLTASSLWNDTAPTSSVFTVGTSSATNGSAKNFVAYLFATCAGVSKVGSYTGTGTTKQVDCGFTGGARFVLIKRTDDVGDWYVWDSARGIVAGNDPYLLLNSTAAEVTSTDYIDTYSAGFEISSTAPAAINASGGTFIFLAIA